MYLIESNYRGVKSVYLTDKLSVIEYARMKEGLDTVFDINSQKYYDWTTATWNSIVKLMKGNENDRFNSKAHSQREKLNDHQGVCDPGISQIERLRWS